MGTGVEESGGAMRWREEGGPCFVGVLKDFFGFVTKYMNFSLLKLYTQNLFNLRNAKWNWI